MSYEIRRHDLNGTCYGERIFSGESLRECLEYLKSIFERNQYQKLERERDTWTKYTDRNVFHYSIRRV